MDILLFLIPVSLMISGVSFIVFYWSVKSEQFDDLDGAAHRILLDDSEEEM